MGVAFAFMKVESINGSGNCSLNDILNACASWCVCDTRVQTDFPSLSF